MYYIYYIYQSILTLEVVDLLQRHDFRMHVDVSLLSTSEQVKMGESEVYVCMMMMRMMMMMMMMSPLYLQHTHTLRGILLFLLVVRCMCLSGVNRTMAASVTLLRLTFSRLLWPMVNNPQTLQPFTFYLNYKQSAWKLFKI